MLFLVTVPVAIVACFILPERSATELSPTTVTLLALAVSLWVALSAERDARARLERAKRAYAVHGETTRLLRDHRLVHLVAMLRLEIVVGCALTTAVWGAGPVTGAWIAAMAGVIMLLAWPSERKTLLLIERAEEKRV
jgi:hypothetical protein